MTTVGYGDKYPKQTWGYLVGSLCVVCGVMVIAFTGKISIDIASYFLCGKSWKLINDCLS